MTEEFIDSEFSWDEPIILINLEIYSLEDRKEIMEDLKKEDSVAFEEFCEMYSERLKELGLEEYI